MRIKVLGCSGGVGPGLRTTSLLVDDHLLIDAGSGVCDLGLDAMANIDNVIVTHSHLDHVLGLAFLADNRFQSAKAAFMVHGIEPTITALRTHLFNWQLWPDFTQLCMVDEPILEMKVIQAGQPFDLSGLSVTPFSVPHSVSAIGYALDDGKRCFAFSGDTSGDEAMWASLNQLPRLDSLMVEIAYPNEAQAVGDAAKHYTPQRLGQHLKQLRHRPDILLSHHKPGVEAAIEAQCHAALEGWSYRHLKRGDVIVL